LVASSESYSGYLRFGNIFGTGNNLIPQGATISSAILTLNVASAASGYEASFSPVNASWDEPTVTHTNRPSASASVDGTMSMGTTGPKTLTVTSRLQSWAQNPSTNWGWKITTTQTSQKGFSSSEAATLASRPKLQVSFESVNRRCAIAADCDDGLFCNGAEVCQSGRCGAGRCEDSRRSRRFE
jgi:hypothetical protein